MTYHILLAPPPVVNTNIDYVLRLYYILKQISL